MRGWIDGAMPPVAGTALAAGMASRLKGNTMPSRSLFTSSLIAAAVSCGVLVGCAEDNTQLPPRFLTREAALAPGAECPFGGVQRSSGYDSNGNAVLDPDEVTQTSNECSVQPIG